MSDNIKYQNMESANEWVNWIEDAISKKHIEYYEFEHFSNVEEIGVGAFGKVFRANKKNSEQYFALKSFFNLNNDTAKTIIREFEHHRNVDFHENIIHFYGITKLKNEIDHSKKYLLVVEYADGGSLRNYLKKQFNNLTWKDKFNLAYQLVHAVTCLHDEEIVHRDLHSCNVLVHQNIIKLADFSLSKGIEEVLKSSSKLIDIVPYTDPKKFGAQSYSLNKKSDVYSVGVLLWEISSGKPPFEGAPDDCLTAKISGGLREKNVPDTPVDYIKLYTECWDDEPDNRPSMHKVVKRLKEIIHRQNENNENLQIPNENSKNSLNSLQRRLSRLTKSQATSVIDEELNEIVNDIMEKIIEITNKGNDQLFCFLNHINNYNVDTKVFRDKLLKNQNDSNNIFLLGYFNYLGIETNRNEKKAFNLFIDASKKNHLLARYYVGKCYESGIGTAKDDKLAFKYFENFTNKEYPAGQLKVGHCCNIGMDVKKDLKLAARWYEHAARNGNMISMCNLGLLYISGNGIDKDDQKAFELFKKSAKEGYSGGIIMLGYCYYYGVGTNINVREAIDQYQRAAELGHNIAQYNLAFIYEKGKGVKRDINQAIDWYEKSAVRGNKDAQDQLDKLNERKENNSCKIA